MYSIKIVLNAVAEGDVTDLAQRIWDREANDFDAKLGDFIVTVSKDNFPVDWTPED